MRKEAEIQRAISGIAIKISKERGQPDSWLMLRRGLRFSLGEIDARGLMDYEPTQEEIDYIYSIPRLLKTRRNKPSASAP